MHAESASRNCCILRFLATDDGELGRTVSVAEVCAIFLDTTFSCSRAWWRSGSCCLLFESKSKGRMMEREVGTWEELRKEGEQKLRKRHEF